MYIRQVAAENHDNCDNCSNRPSTGSPLIIFEIINKVRVKLCKKCADHALLQLGQAVKGN